jgi:hypothetical protein
VFDEEESDIPEGAEDAVMDKVDPDLLTARKGKKGKKAKKKA